MSNPVKNFEGKWKEVKSENDSAFIGVEWKPSFEFLGALYTCTSKMGTKKKLKITRSLHESHRNSKS